MNTWFEALGRRFSEAARERGATVASPELDPQVADELLELARVASHSKERRFAPLACYMAGVAVERLRQAGSVSARDEAAYLRTIRESLEQSSGGRTPPPPPPIGGRGAMAVSDMRRPGR